MSRGGRRVGAQGESIRWDGRPIVGALRIQGKNVEFGACQIGVQIQAVLQFPYLCVWFLIILIPQGLYESL